MYGKLVCMLNHLKVLKNTTFWDASVNRTLPALAATSIFNTLLLLQCYLIFTPSTVYSNK